MWICTRCLKLIVVYGKGWGGCGGIGLIDDLEHCFKLLLTVLRSFLSVVLATLLIVR